MFDDSTELGKSRWGDLKKRVVEHNIRIMATYYTKISLKRMAFLLSLTEAEAEDFLSTMVVNKTVLTKFEFPSFQVLGIGQMVATIIILYVTKKLNYISFPDLSTDTFRKIWPLPLMYLGELEILRLTLTKFTNLNLIT